MNNLYVVGGGGFSSEVLFVIERIQAESKQWSEIHIIDDLLPCGNVIRGYEVIGAVDLLLSLSEEIDLVITINDCKTRKLIVEKIKKFNRKINFPNIVDISAICDLKYLSIGEGNIIMHNTVLSTKVVVGDFNIFNSYTGIGHDARIGNFNTFNPRVAISGNVFIGDLNNFGLNSSVLQKKLIGSNNEIWINTVITKNIKNDSTYFGVPAKKISL